MVKCVLDLLKETGMLCSKPVETPMEENHHLRADEGDSIQDISTHKRLVGRLIQMITTMPATNYGMGFVFLFIHSPCTTHLLCLNFHATEVSLGKGLLDLNAGYLTAKVYRDADWAGCQPHIWFSLGSNTFVCGNLVTQNSKKQCGFMFECKRENT